MPDFSGPVQPIAVSHLLIVLLLAPLVAAFVSFAKGTKDHAARTKLIRSGALVTALFTVAIAAMLLAQATGERFLFQHVARWLRAGELDANFDLACDPLAAAAVLAAAILAATGAGAKRANAVAMLAAAAFVVLSGDLAGMTVGLLLVAALSWRLLGRARALSFAAVGAMAIATAFLFWGTGGEWHPDGYGSDFRARLAAVAVGTGGVGDVKTPATRGQGLLTISAYPGSPIFLDDSRTPYETGGQQLYTPFARVPLPAGTHSIRVHPGMGEDDQLVAQQVMGDGKELALVPIGSTLSPRALEDELSLVDSAAATSWRDTYLARRLFGSVRVAPVSACLFVLVALLQATAAALAAARGALSKDDAKVATMAGAMGAFVLVRLRPSLAFALPAAALWTAIATAAVLAAIPLLLSLRARGGENVPDVQNDEDDDAPSLLLGLTTRLASFGRFDEAATAPATATPNAAVASRASIVDAVVAGVVLLFILALVAGR